MNIDVLLFTQTMHSLLSSFLSLQNALAVCSEILTGKKEKKCITEILKKVNEGKKLSEVLSEQKYFSPLYVSLVAIGEQSGTMAQVFGHLGMYLKDQKNIRRKMVQALLYPVLVLATAFALVFILTVFVLPRLEGIFEAFTSSSEDIGMQMATVKVHIYMTVVIILSFTVLLIAGMMIHKVSKHAAYMIDSILLKIPFVKNLVMTMQMHDFSFAMKLLTETHFPLVQSLEYAMHVLSNRRIKHAVEQVCRNITDGHAIGEAFEREKIFPRYLTAWIRIAEENGAASQAFNQICEYYQSENENMITGITQAAEPVFILITGVIIIAVIAQFVIPVFNLLGAL